MGVFLPTLVAPDVMIIYSLETVGGDSRVIGARCAHVTSTCKLLSGHVTSLGEQYLLTIPNHRDNEEIFPIVYTEYNVRLICLPPHNFDCRSIATIVPSSRLKTISLLTHKHLFSLTSHICCLDGHQTYLQECQRYTGTYHVVTVG